MYRTNRCMDGNPRDFMYQGTGGKEMSMEGGMPMGGMTCPPIYECPVERVCHREICHEVPHIMPCKTKIINHHIYRHTYTPCYSCCEENEISNVYENKCCF